MTTPLASAARLLAMAAGVVFLAAPRASADPDPRIVRAWKAKCASCHGADGKGQTEQGKKMAVRDMTDKAWQKEFPDAKLTETILGGIQRDKNGKKQEMKPFKDKLKPEEIDGLIALIRGLAK